MHVRPTETGGAGPQIGFDAEVPTAGAFRLFLDFKHDGVVRGVHRHRPLTPSIEVSP